MEEVDNFGKPESVQKDEKGISEFETHVMPSIGVINKGHLVQKLLLIPTQENPYMIQLLVKDISTLSLMHLGYVPQLNFVPPFFLSFFMCWFVIACCFVSAYVLFVACFLKPLTSNDQT
jgi:hypothetical protein